MAPAYRGAELFVYAYAVPMLAALPNALIAAMAAARFAGGLGSVLETHVNVTTSAAYTEGGMSIMARYRGPVVVVAAARIKATTLMTMGMTMWKYRSPVLSA
jgi:hypothetical protein